MEMALSPDGRKEEGSMVLPEEKRTESGQAIANGYIQHESKLLLKVFNIG